MFEGALIANISGAPHTREAIVLTVSLGVLMVWLMAAQPRVRKAFLSP